MEIVNFHVYPIRQVVISAPYRGANSWEVYQSCLLVEQVAAEVLKLVNPLYAHNMRNLGELVPVKFWLDAYCDLIRRCDALLLCGEHEASEGCQIELSYAKLYNIPVFYTVEGLKNWADAETLTKDQKHE